MQRTGRSGHAQFRVIVQDSRFHPTRGKIVAYLGSYDPHTKSANLDKELAAKYLGNGAQPSDRAASLLQKEGIKLPDWVKLSAPKKRSIKNVEKLRKNRPAEPVAEETAAPAETAEASEAPVESAEEAPVQEETVAEEAPAQNPEEPQA